MIKSIALSSIPVLIRTTVAQTGCHPEWTSGSAYSSGSLVSATRVVNATAGTTVTKNFECNSGDSPELSHCPNYDPSNEVLAEAVWLDLGECTGVAPTGSPTSPPTFVAWSGTGCPEDWAEGNSYEGGQYAALDGIVYKCSEEQYVNEWCGDASYKPGDSGFWEMAWSIEGSCTGTIAPTTSPVFVSLTDAGGCPDAFTADAVYQEGDKVEMDGLVYECRSWPNSALCSRAEFEPNSANSGEAWTLVGHCDGSIAPTTSPVFATLTNAGGCPQAYSDTGDYEAGDKVGVEVTENIMVVYECDASPNDAFCNQYEPGHWSKHGWVLQGYCEGTIAPTSSPVFVALEDQNGCPEAYSDTATYEPDDKVSVDIDGTNSLVYQCHSDVNQSRFCSQFEPGKSLGWTLIGHCSGTIAPTSAPNFVSLTDLGGCPPTYDETTTYEASDLVTFIVSEDPEQAVVYECKAFPDGAYCNAGSNFAPGSNNVDMGWTLKGSCAGTFSPSASPVVYPELKCRWYNGTEAVIIYPWAESSLTTYGAGTRVRKEDKIYKCKGYPFSLWCTMAAFEPEESSHWTEAWDAAGTCVDMFAPTTSPSISPTGSPSTPPTTSPSNSPSLSPTASPSASPSKSPVVA